MITVYELNRALTGYRDLLVDLGTGDGRFVLNAARMEPGLFGIGVDACRENLRSASHHAPNNVLFAIANVASADCTLSDEIFVRAAQVTINFPWGSLRDALLSGAPQLLDGLWAMMRPGARLEVRLNASALAETGWELYAAGNQMSQNLADYGFKVRAAQALAAPDLRGLSSTWGKRIAFSRRPEAVLVLARR